METKTRVFGFLPALLVLVLVLAPFVGGGREVAGTAALSMIVLLTAAVLLWSGRFERPAALWPFIVFLALLAASAAVTVSLHATMRETFYFAACAAAAMAASSMFREDGWSAAAVLAVVGAGAALGVLAIREYAHSSADWRVFGPFESPGFFGGYLVLVAPLALAAALAVRSLVLSAVSIGVWGLSAAALALTGTRFAMASALAAVVVFAALALWTRSLRRRHFAWLAAAALIAVIAAVLAIAPTAARLRGKAAVEQSHSLPFRVATWKGTVSIIRANPLLGTGAGTFPLAFQRYMVAGYTRMAHNGYLQIASEAGVPALIAAAVAFGTLLLAGLRGLRGNKESESALLGPDGMRLLACGVVAALIGSLARNLMDSDIYNPGIGFTFWILAGLAAARGPVRREASLSIPVRVGVSVVIAAVLVVCYTFALGEVDEDSGMAAWSNGEVLEAGDYFRSAAALDPLSGDHWLRLGQWEVATSDGDRAQFRQGIAHIRRAAQLEPTRARNYIVLGRTLADDGDSRAAIAAYQKALEVDPHATPAMVALARLIGGAGGEAMYRRLLDEERSPFERLKGVPELVNPDYAWAHYYFAQKLMKQGRYDEAADHFRNAADRLKKRESYKMYREVADAMGMTSPEEEAEIDRLLADSEAGLRKALSHLHSP